MMSQHSFLLQQMLELTSALHRPPDKEIRQRRALLANRALNEFRRQFITEIHERRKAGESFGSIAHVLNKRGIPGEHGGRWYAATVRSVILRTPV